MWCVGCDMYCVDAEIVYQVVWCGGRRGCPAVTEQSVTIAVHKEEDMEGMEWLTLVSSCVLVQPILLHLLGRVLC